MCAGSSAARAARARPSSTHSPRAASTCLTSTWDPSSWAAPAGRGETPSPTVRCGALSSAFSLVQHTAAAKAGSWAAIAGRRRRAQVVPGSASHLVIEEVLKGRMICAIGLGFEHGGCLRRSAETRTGGKDETNLLFLPTALRDSYME
eukprot:3591233-Prymnesium_polylepis.1